MTELRRIHAVFPKEAKDLLLRGMADTKYEVVNFDYSFDTFYHWALSREETIADVALVADSLKNDLPMEMKLEEYITKLTEIRIKRPTLRLIILLPSEANHKIQFKEKLVKLGVYDFYFTESFSLADLIHWIENPKNLGDMKDYILIESNESFSKESNNIKASSGNHVESKDEIAENSRISRRQEKLKVKKIYEEKIIERVVTIKPKKMAVHSLSKGAGSTFHSLNLAAYFAEKGISVGMKEDPLLQTGKTYLADALNLYELENNDLISTPSYIKRKLPIMQEQVPTCENINFYTLNPELDQITNFEYEEYLRYLNVGGETLQITDFGYLSEEILNKEWSDLFSQFDLHLVCVDLMPTSVIPNLKRLNFFLSDLLNIPVQFIINKHAHSVNDNDIDDIGINSPILCPYLGYDTIFEAIYKNQIPYGFDSSIKEELNIVYEDIESIIGLQAF